MSALPANSQVTPPGQAGQPRQDVWATIANMGMAPSLAGPTRHAPPLESALRGEPTCTEWQTTSAGTVERLSDWGASASGRVLLEAAEPEPGPERYRSSDPVPAEDTSASRRSLPALAMGPDTLGTNLLAPGKDHCLTDSLSSLPALSPVPVMGLSLPRSSSSLPAPAKGPDTLGANALHNILAPGRSSHTLHSLHSIPEGPMGLDTLGTRAMPSDMTFHLLQGHDNIPAPAIGPGLMASNVMAAEMGSRLFYCHESFPTPLPALGPNRLEYNLLASDGAARLPGSRSSLPEAMPAPVILPHGAQGYCLGPATGSCPPSTQSSQSAGTVRPDTLASHALLPDMSLRLPSDRGSWSAEPIAPGAHPLPPDMRPRLPHSHSDMPGPGRGLPPPRHSLRLPTRSRLAEIMGLQRSCHSLPAPPNSSPGSGSILNIDAGSSRGSQERQPSKRRRAGVDAGDSTPGGLRRSGCIDSHQNRWL